jgi:hypothetical protein
MIHTTFKLKTLKSTFNILGILFFSKILVAQAVISNAYFPSVGDTLALARASDATSRLVTITPSADNQTWNYAFLDSISRSIEKYDTVPDFIKLAMPNADLMANIDGQEIVFNKTDSRFEILRMGIFRFGNLLLKLNFTPNNPILERRAALSYITVNNNRSVAVAVLNPSQLPDSLINKLPVRPDSIRLTVTNIRQDYVDAWGNLTIPKATYPVLRVRCIEINEQRIEVKNSNNWQDVTPQYFNGNPNPQDTSITYSFWSEGVQTSILRLTMDNQNRVKKAEYRIEPPNALTVTGIVRFWTGQGMPNVTVKIGNDSLKTDNNGQFRFTNIAIGKNLPITLSKSDSYENGVEGLDLLLIRRHIIGITEFDSKFKFFAADVSGNNDVDGADILFVRRLIVGINDNFPNTTPWRFVRVSTAEKPAFPFSFNDTFPLTLSFSSDMINFDFFAVKKGDVDGSAQR